MTENGAGRPNFDALSQTVQALVRERLARDPQRLERILAEAEAAAWAEVAGLIKDAMKTAIVAQLYAGGQPGPGTETPPATDDADDFVVQTAAASRAADDAPAPDAPASVQAEAIAESAGPAAIGSGIYVYGVIASGSAALPHIDGVASGSSVRLHERGRLAAVVSEVPLDEYGQGALEANLGDLTWLEQSVRRHQAVLDEMVSLSAVAPMKFATIYLNSTGLDTWLADQEETLLPILAYLRNRQEWGLKLFVDRAVLAEKVTEYSEPLQELRGQMEGKTQGAAYFLVRRLQELTAEEVERVSFTVADDIHRVLAQQSVAACLNLLPPDDVEPNVQMVLNAAYLIADEHVQAVAQAIEAFADEHGDNGFRFQWSGPWPAYNFVSMAADAEETDHDD